MAIQKRPYELSVWVEKLNGSNSKIEEKGVIIGAHDMSYPGRATNIVLKREIKGTNTLTFQLPDRYFDSLKGDYVRNEFADLIFPETKLKLFYKDRWFEFFVKKVDDKKQFKSYMKSFTCTDAFIDELSRNGYGIIYDTELYNNVEEIGTFTEEVLEDSIWQYHPENNWGDFTEYKEEKLYRIPISCFGGKIGGYKLNFELIQEQRDEIKEKTGTDFIKNAFTGEERPVELSDDLARGFFWDEYVEEGTTRNQLTKEYHENIDNDGYIYVPYSCLGFCYGSKTEPDFTDKLKYDRAATETAIDIDDKIILAPQSVDPRTIIQFYVIPKTAMLELDDDGVILNKDYTFFMTLTEWNNAVNMGKDWWYIFEDTRLVQAEVLGSADVAAPSISHTFKYLKDGDGKIKGTDFESRGNKCVIYDGYLSDVNENTIVKGKKFSITNRTEVNISEEIDQYTTVYNCHADNFVLEYSNEDWEYQQGERTENNESYRVCSKLETRQVIPQLARNLVQNGTDMDSTDGWSPMSYLLTDSIFLTPALSLRGVSKSEQEESISTSSLIYSPAMAAVGLKWSLTVNATGLGLGNIIENYDDSAQGYDDFIRDKVQSWLDGLSFHYNNKTYAWSEFSWCDLKYRVQDELLKIIFAPCFPKYLTGDEEAERTNDLAEVALCANGDTIYYKYYPDYLKTKDDRTTRHLDKDKQIYKYLCNKNDWIIRGLTSTVRIDTQASTVFVLNQGKEYRYEYPDENGEVIYYLERGKKNNDEYTYLSYVLTTDAGNQFNLYEKVSYEKEEEGKKVVITGTEEKKYEGNVNVSHGIEMVNFGIIGQEKTIQKDKIYCLGVSAFFDEPFQIKIGKGALISDGEYTIAQENQLVFNCGPDGDIVVIPNGLPQNIDDEKKNLIIPDLPDTRYILFKTKKDIENPYFVISSGAKIVLLKLYLFEAYTKGIDAFPDNGKLQYRYSGRNLFWAPKKLEAIDRGTYERTTNTFLDKDVEGYINIKNMIIFEDDIMLGSTYGYQHYYIQRLKTKEDVPKCYDTMGAKEFISSDPDKIGTKTLPLDAADYTDEDYDIETNYIDLNKCSYYDKEAEFNQFDCKYGNGHTCFYQKFGYCPFRFPTEKHNRRIRTLSVNKSNRFNIIQETSKVFEVYPQFYIEHKSNGSIVQEDGHYLKKVFFITEKGRENKVGFRYEKNLKDISRNIVSDKIVTKLYVLDVDSDLSKTGLCSIKTAEDNPSKDSYLINLDYYIEKGMLDGDEVEEDLYGITPNILDLEHNPNEIPHGFLQQLGYYNTCYDELSNKIINLQDSSFTELQANLEVNYQGIVTAQEQILKIKKQLDKYKATYASTGQYETQQAYLNYKVKLAEQESILTQLIYSTFYTDGKCDLAIATWDGDCFDHGDAEHPWPQSASPDDVSAVEFFSHILDVEESKKYWIDLHKYTKGILGQFNSEYLQIQQWKRERASYLKLINQISSAFYKKYEPYLKEGTWSDSNYLTDNAYYFGALDVAADGSIPKVSYTISVIDLAPLSEEYEEIYDFDLADITYVEDIGMFGYDKHTGLPNKLKVLVSAVQEGLDDPSKDTISVQNFTTSFQDLFQQVSASVQSLTYNENIYKRSSNFTSLQNITTSSLQGALDTNDLTLLDTQENNIQVDNTGTSGSDINNHANKYKLDGQGLFFSNDGGQHWSVGVGPSGINADYIKVGTLDAGKIRIADSSYVYFSWDKDGIVAYRDPQGINTDTKNINDMAIFNKYGLSIVKNGKIKLRAGYNYNSDYNGDITKETEQEYNIGFYLYNDTGVPIFSTTEAGDGARLSLTGEIFVNNSAVTSSGEATYLYSGEYSSEPHNNCYDVKMVNGLHYTENTYNQYLNLSVGDIIDIGGVNYEVVTKTTEEALIKYEENLLKATQYHYDFADPEDEQKAVIYSIDFFFGGFKGLTQIYFEVNGGKYSVNFTKLVESSEKVSTIDRPLTAPHRFGNYRTDKTETDPATGVTYYKRLYGENGGDYGVGAFWIGEGGTNTYWANKKQRSGSSGNNGDVALFINTTNVTSAANDSRLLVCCKQDSTEAYNLFAIQKGGNLYIGGKLREYDGNKPADLSSLNDRIKVIEPALAIEQRGGRTVLLMDFANFVNTDNEGQDLKSFVNNAVSQGTSGLAGSHYHTISSHWGWADVYSEDQFDDWANGILKADQEPRGKAWVKYTDDSTNWWNP